MDAEKKVDLLMNVFYNLILAVLLSLIAEAVNAGGVTWPAIAIDSLISFVLEMLIVLFLPFTKWGFRIAIAHAEIDSTKFRLIAAVTTAIPFATLMSLLMSLIGTVVMAHLPLIAWLFAFLRIWGMFIAIAAVCSFLLIPPIVALCRKMLGVPKPDHDKQPVEL